MHRAELWNNLKRILICNSVPNIYLIIIALMNTLAKGYPNELRFGLFSAL